MRATRAMMTMAMAMALLMAPPGWALQVVADIAPVHSLVAQVMGETGRPVLLLDGQDDPHHFTLRPSQARAVQQADLVIWIGPALTPALVPVIDNLGGGGGLALMDNAARQRAAADHDHDHDEEDGADGHDHGDNDPHLWLDPDNAHHWLGVIATELGRRDPAHAGQYHRNAEQAAAAIAALDAGLQARLAPLAGRPFITGHAAYGYFIDHYGLTDAGSIAASDAAPPGAARIRQLRAAMLAEGAICAFPELGRNPQLLRTVTADTAVRLGAELDPEGRGLVPGPGLYADLLRNLAENIAACLEVAP